MEDLEDKIGTEQDRKKEAEESLKARNKLLVGIREGLDHMVQTLVSTVNLLSKSQASAFQSLTITWYLHSTVSPPMNLKINKSPCFDSVLEVLCISGTSKAHASALMSPVVTLDFLWCLQWSTE